MRRRSLPISLSLLSAAAGPACAPERSQPAAAAAQSAAVSRPSGPTVPRSDPPPPGRIVAERAARPVTGPQKRAVPVDDITGKARAWNAPPNARPPASFHTIGVSRRALSASRTRKRPDVFYTQRKDALRSGGTTGGPARPTEFIAKTGRRAFRGKRLLHAEGAVYLSEQVQRRSRYHGKGVSDDTANGFSGGAPAAAKAAVAAKLWDLGTVSNLRAYQGSRLLLAGGRSYASMGDEVVASDARSGQKLWARKVPGDLARAGGHLAAPPVMAGGQIFVATLKGTTLQIDPGTGAVAKTFRGGHPVRSQPAIHEGWIYVGTENGRLVAIDTGDRRLTGWTQWGGDAARTGVRWGAAQLPEGGIP